MKKIAAIVLCALAIVLLVTVVQKSGLVKQYPGSQLAQVSYPPISQTSPINPTSFFRFDGTDTNGSSIGTKQLSTNSTTDTTPNFQILSGGPVGKFARFTSSTGEVHVTGGTGITNAFAIEFLFRPGQGFNNTEFYNTADGSISIRWNPRPTAGTSTSTNYLSFKTKTASGEHDLRIDMNGSGARSNAYYTDGNWHHMVFKRNADGSKEIWVDGTVPASFSSSAPSGNLVSTSATTDTYINKSASYRKFFGDLDELAIYAQEMPGNLVAQHQSDRVAGTSYQNWTAIASVLQGGSTTGVLDPKDYPPGASLSTSIPYTTGITDKPVAQLKKYPLPRFSSTNTLLPNISWANMTYQGQVNPDSNVQNATTAANARDIMDELAKNWNYAISINNVRQSSQFTNTATTHGALTQLANQHPEYPLAALIYRAQLPAVKNSANSWDNYFQVDTLPNDHYLQNASGQFIKPYGSTVTTSTMKYWRPSAPIADYAGDGQYVKDTLITLATAMPNRLAAKPTSWLTYLAENGEQYHQFSTAAIAADPVVSAAATASGLSPQAYVAKRYADNMRQAYRDIAKTAPGAAGAYSQEYAIDGGPIDRFPWAQARMLQDAMPNGQRYATPDFYPRWPTNWMNWSGAWHGWQWMMESLAVQRASGDKFYSPFVSAGWNTNSTGNVTPGQYLGMLKMLAATGAEYFYAGYFNEINHYEYPCAANNSTCPDIIGLPETYTWQNVTPSYVQALVSRVESFYRASDLMTGDLALKYENPGAGMGYNFKTHDPNVLVVVRKLGSKYLITGNINQTTNNSGSIEEEKKVTITLDGQDVSFKVRRQGSMYMYDKSNASAPVFYQLDAWHESSHPSWWSKNFLVDAELYDSGTATIKTTGYTGGDFSQSDSYVNSTGPLGYKFTPRDTSPTTFYLWVRARASSGTANVSASVDGGTSLLASFPAGAFTWIKLPGSFSGVALNQAHTLLITPGTGLDLEKFVLTPDVSYVPSQGVSAGDIQAPTAPVNISSPLQTSTTADITWSASIDDVGVVAYDIYKNSVLEGTSSSTSYTAIDLTPATDYEFAVKARDAAGNVSNASVTLAVRTLSAVDTDAPSTPSSLTSSNITSDSFTVSWSPSTDNVGVDGYEVTRNGTALQTILTTTTYNASGLTEDTDYTVSVRARDVAGNWSSSSAPLTIHTSLTEDTTAPAGAVIVPAANLTHTGTITITVSATDNRLLDHVDFYRSTNTLLGSAVATGTSGQYSYSWNTSTVANNTYNLYAKIYDKAGNAFTTPNVKVTIANVVVPPPDTTAPIISMTAPQDGASVSGDVVALNANATDNVGVTKVEFYRGGTLVDTDTTAPFEVPFDSTAVTNGSYSFNAKAYDTAGNMGTSQTINITVNNIIPDTTVPTVSISAPADNSTATGNNVSLTANATDNIGIASVKFFKSDDSFLGDATLAQGSSYVFGWDTTSVSNGNVTFYAKAYDTAGNFAQSSNRTVSVNNADTVNPSKVTNLSTSTVGTTSVTLTWNSATDNVAIKGYDVFKDVNNGNNRYVTGAPGTSYTITGLTPNTAYNFGVTSRDTSNNVALSPTMITVTTAGIDNIDPVVTITNPLDGVRVTKNSVVTITANASDNVGVTRVEFVVNNSIICTVTTAPYSCNWTVPWTFTNANYELKLRAFDASGNMGYKIQRNRAQN